MNSDKRVLFDSNVLVYVHNQDSPFYAASAKFLTLVITGEMRGVLAQQNLLEFYSIVTDARRVTHPLSPHEAASLVAAYLQSPFTIVVPTTQTAQLALTMSKHQHLVNGRIFDAYLAATMITNEVQVIVTANVKDFASFPELEVIDLRDAGNR